MSNLLSQHVAFNCYLSKTKAPKASTATNLRHSLGDGRKVETMWKSQLLATYAAYGIEDA